MKKSIFIFTLFLITSLCASAFDRTPLYYQDGGREYRITRWDIRITGMTKFIEFIDSRDTEVHYQGSLVVQNMYLYEKEDNNYMYFQRYCSKASPTAPNTGKYTPQNIWAKVSKDWSVYIDSKGVSHQLYKK